MKEDQLMKVDLDRIKRGVLSIAESEAVAEELRRYRLRFQEEKEEHEDCKVRGHVVKKSAPYQALLSIARVSSNSCFLWQSNLNHQHYIRMTISCSQENKSEGYTHLAEGPEIVEIYMSEMQFAQAITSMNCGVGTPVTLDSLCGFSIPGPKNIEDDKAAHQANIKRMALKGLEDLAEIREVINGWATEKKRPTLKEVADVLKSLDIELSRIPSNFAYVESLLNDRMEERVVQAKSEVNAHVQSTVTQLGLQSLEQLRIERKPDAP